MKKDKIIMLKLDNSVRILDHPNQSNIYSDKIDDDFLESIKIHGVKQKPVIAYLNDLADGMPESLDPATENIDCFVIISGHRRIQASKKAGYESIACELRHYDNYFDSEVDHIVFNKQRNKTKKEIAGELIAYKQKLSQIRKELTDNGLKAVEKYKSFNVGQYVQKDENGRYFLPLGSEMIEKELGVTEKRQKQLNVIFNGDWVQDKIELIFHSKLNKKEKKRLTELFSKHVDDGREEVDKENGFSVNKVYNELIRAWNEIDGIINPKPNVKKTKKKSTTKVWVKVKDFASKVDVIPQGSSIVDTDEDGFFYLFGNENNEHQHKVDYAIFLKYLKEQL